MEQFIQATFIDGVFKPIEPVNLPPGATVRLVVKDNGKAGSDDAAWDEFERMTEEYSVSGLHRLTREQLHDRRV